VTASGRRVRPRDAAGIVLLRPPPTEGAAPVVLLGRRAAHLRFMPGFWVVPGGRYDPGDGRGLPGDLGGAQSVADSVIDRLNRRCSRYRAVGLARTALRELWEEVGLLAADSGPLPPGTPERDLPPAWQAYARAGRRPAWERLDYVVRAVTPPSNPVRFDTRFFVAVDPVLISDGPGDGELEDVDWFPLDRLHGLRLASVTRFVLSESRRLWETGAIGKPRSSTATFFYRDDRPEIRYA